MFHIAVYAHRHDAWLPLSWIAKVGAKGDQTRPTIDESGQVSSRIIVVFEGNFLMKKYSKECNYSSQKGKTIFSRIAQESKIKKQLKPKKRVHTYP